MSVQSAILSTTVPSGPLFDPKTGQATFAFIKWMQNLTQLINQAFDQQANLSPNSLPYTSPTTIGCIFAIAAVAHQWISSIDDNGEPQLTQPAFADISGVATEAQLPAALVRSVNGLVGVVVLTAANVGADAAGAAATAQSNAETFASNASNLSSGTVSATLIPTLNQNTTGTAANITATSNSTLTTLSDLSLPYSQITGTPATGVTQLVAGTNVTISPSGGTGVVTVNASAADSLAFRWSNIFSGG